MEGKETRNIIEVKREHGGTEAKLNWSEKGTRGKEKKNELDYRGRDQWPIQSTV